MKGDNYISALLPLIIVNGAVIFLFIIFAFIYPKRERSTQVMDKMHTSFLGVRLREFWYWLINPPVKLCSSLKLTPNMLTGFSIILALASGYFYFKGDIALAGWFLIINGSFDMLDGELARTTNQITKAGAFFDSTLDRFSEGFVLLGIALFFRNNFVMLTATILTLLGSLLVSYAKARGEAVGATTKRGLMQRPERIALLASVSVLSPFFGLILQNFNIAPEMPLLVTMIIMAALTNYTAVVRTIILFNDLKKAEQ